MSESDTSKLDPQHVAFINAYFDLGFNGTRAAIAAKYSRKTARQQASRLLTRVDIRDEIDRRLEEEAMGRHEVLARLAQEARGDMRDFIGKSSKELEKHPDGNLIKKYKNIITTTTVTTIDAEGNPVIERTIEEKIDLELYDAQAANIQLGRHHGLFTDKTDFTTGGDKLIAPMVFLPAVAPESDEQ